MPEKEREKRELVGEDLWDLVVCLSPAAFLPQGARRHVLAAQKELLLALRSLLDAAIEEEEAAEGRQRRRATRVPVE